MSVKVNEMRRCAATGRWNQLDSHFLTVWLRSQMKCKTGFRPLIIHRPEPIISSQIGRMVMASFWPLSYGREQEPFASNEI